MEKLNIKKLVAEQLESDGWTQVSEFDFKYTHSVAVKSYETAVLPKSCYVMMIPVEGGFQLVGNYQSEGRNILSTTWLDIPVGQPEEQLRAGVREFSAMVDHAVDQSYARRLYLNRA